MTLARNLAAWQTAGLIDAGTAAAIARYEANRERPLARWAALGLGALALVLGVMLLVAANWDAVSDGLKLGGHALLTLGAAAAVWRGSVHNRTRLLEVGLALLGALTLGGFALQAQVFQLSGPAWSLLAAVAALIAPAVLLLGRTRLTADGFALLLVATALAFAMDDTAEWRDVGLAAGAAVPAMLVLLSLTVAGDRLRFGEALRGTGVGLALAGATLAQIAWASNITPAQAVDGFARLGPAAALAVLAAILVARRDPLRPRHALVTTALVGSAAAALAALALPHPEATSARLAGLFVFGALWMAVAIAARRADAPVVFNIAVALLAVRLFVVYLELFYSLATTGIGLVLGGALLLALVGAWTRITRVAKR